MIFPYRKFFLFCAALSPLFACALPNFAALAPTPTPLLSAEFVEDESFQPPTFTESAGTVVVPALPESIDDLATPSNGVGSEEPVTPINLAAGVSYQIRQSVILNHEPKAGQRLIYSLSAGGRLTLLDSSGNRFPGVISGESNGGSYTFFAQAVPPALQVQVDVDEFPAGKDHLTLTVEDLAQADNRMLNTTGFIDETILERVEFEASAGQSFVAILQPSPQFDGVLELYGPEGHVVTLDENGAGETETLIYEPDQSGDWVFTIFGFQDSFGDFELVVISLP